MTLRRPFARVEQILTESPRSSNRLVASFPRELEAICLKALEKDPKDRYPTAHALADDLRRWLEIRPTVAGKANILRRSGMWARRRPAAAFAAGMTAAFLLVACLGAVQVYQREIERERAQTDKLRAKDRELGLLVQRLRQPTRRMDWFASVWENLRLLRGGAQSHNPQLQGEATAALEGSDAQLGEDPAGRDGGRRVRSSLRAASHESNGNARAGRDLVADHSLEPHD